METYIFADIIVKYASLVGKPISPLQVHEVLYYIQGWSSAYFDSPFFDEEPQAWVNGPVYMSIYESLGSSSEPLRKDNSVDQHTFEKQLTDTGLEDEKLELIMSVLKKYVPMPIENLLIKTLNETPWKVAREGIASFKASDKLIKIKNLKEFFTSKIVVSS